MKKKFVLLLSFTVFSSFLFAQEERFAYLQKVLPDPYDQAAYDKFGFSVAYDRDVAVVGEYGYDATTGRVTVYVHVKDEWQMAGELRPSQPAKGMMFGYSVAIYGDTIVVGAPGDPAGGLRCGAVYFFGKPKRGWQDMTEDFRLLPKEPSADRYFGIAVGLTGRLLAVGAPLEDRQQGKVYLYRKYKEWSPATDFVTLTTTDGAAYDRFGEVLDVWGNTVVVGAPFKAQNQGKVYVFVEPAGGWEEDMQETCTLSATGLPSLPRFGSKVAIWDDLVVVSIRSVQEAFEPGKVFLYQRPPTGWTDMSQTATLLPSNTKEGDRFGSGLDVYGDTVVVGAWMADGHVESSGAVYVFMPPKTGWSDKTEDALLTAGDGEAYDHLGEAVSVGASCIIAGAPGRHEEGAFSGAAYVFLKKTDSPWKNMLHESKFLPQSYLNNQGDHFGETVAVSGDYAVIGSPLYDQGRGKVYLYHYENDHWKKVAVLAPTDESPDGYFGKSVDIDSITVVVGAPGADGGKGVVYLYERPAKGWKDMTETARLQQTPAFSSDHLGQAVAIDGNTVVAGCPNYKVGDFYEGAVFLFEKPAMGWTDMSQTAVLTASDGDGYYYLGSRVDISGNTVVASAPGEGNFSSRNRGMVYLFEKPADGWSDMTETARLSASNAAAGDKFGRELCLDDSTVVVASDSRSHTGRYTGMVYVFAKPAGGWSDMTETAQLRPSNENTWFTFGNSVAVYGGCVAVGSEADVGNYPGSGAVKIYEYPAGGWQDTTETYVLKAPDGERGDAFGADVSLTPSRLLVSAPRDNEQGWYSGSAYFFEGFDMIRITGMPEDHPDLCPDSEVQLTVAADNVEKYRWEVSLDGGATFTPLQDDATYSGTADDTLTVLFNVSLDSARYRCVMTNRVDSVATDTVALLLEREAPHLETRDAMLALNATGFVVIPPAEVVVSASDNCGIADTLLSRDTLRQTGPERVAVTVADNSGNITTDTVTVTVVAQGLLDSIHIHVVPESRMDLCPGSEIQLTVAADNVKEYRWEVDRDGSNTFVPLQDDAVYSGTTGDTLTVLFDASLDSTVYRCVLSNYADTVMTDPVILTLDTELPVLVVQGVTLQLDSSGFVVLDAADLVSSASDNCGVADTLISVDTLRQAGNYFVDVTVTDVSGNSVTGTAPVTVEAPSVVAALPEMPVQIYPNPAGDRIRVVCKDGLAERLEIRDVTGRLRLAVERPAGVLDVSRLPEGLYFVEVKYKGITYRLKMIKQ